jgi:hypothetical protein
VSAQAITISFTSADVWALVGRLLASGFLIYVFGGLWAITHMDAGYSWESGRFVSEADGLSSTYQKWEWWHPRKWTSLLSLAILLAILATLIYLIWTV